MRHFGITVLILAVTLLPASGATYYVNNAAGANCADGGGGTSRTAPLCTLGAANTKASAVGDTVLVAEGTTYSLGSAITIKKASQTWKAYDANNDGTTGKWTIDLGGAAGNFRAIAIWYAYPADNVTIENLVINRVGGLSSADYFAAIEAQRHGVTIRNVEIYRPVEVDAPAKRYYAGATGIIIEGYDYLVENVTISGFFAVGISVKQQGILWYPQWSGSSWAQCPTSASDPRYADPSLSAQYQFRGGTVRNVTIRYEYDDSVRGTSAGLGCLFLEGMGDSRVGKDDASRKPVHNFYNVWCKWTGPSPNLRESIYIRESTDKINIWNSYFERGKTGIYFQEAAGCYPEFRFADAGGQTGVCQACGPEFVNIFNNTFVAGSTRVAGSEGMYWPTCYNSNVVNNIFYNYDRAITLAGYATGTVAQANEACRQRENSGGYNIDDGKLNTMRSGSIRNNLFYDGTQDGACQLGGSSTCYGDSPNTTYTDLCTRSGNIYDFPDDGIDPNPRLTVDGHIQANAYALNRASDNPLGTGANTCSLTDGIRVASCLLDKDGDLRPLAGGWDIGCDELSSGGTPTVPPPPTGLARTDR